MFICCLRNECVEGCGRGTGKQRWDTRKTRDETQEMDGQPSMNGRAYGHARERERRGEGT